MKYFLQGLFLVFFAQTGWSYSYSIPLRFDVSDRVVIAPLEMSYDMESSKGHDIEIYSARFGADTFKLNIDRYKNLPNDLQSRASKVDVQDYVLAMRWPTQFLPSGQLEAITRSGQSLWRYLVPANKEGFLLVQKINQVAEPLFNLKESVRFCLTYEAKDFEKLKGFTRICTAYYKGKKTGKDYKFKIIKSSPVPARVIAYGDQGKNKGTIVIKDKTPFQFYAETVDKLSCEFNVTPEPIKMVEAIYTKEGDKIKLITEGAEPLYPKAIDINKTKEGYFVQLLGLESTIGNSKHFWLQSLPKEKSQIYVTAEGGGIFLQNIEARNLPTDDMRVFIDKRTIQSTYIDGAKVYGRKKLDQLKVSSEQNEASANGNDVTWHFGAHDKGEVDRSYLLITDNDQTYKSYYEIFRGYPAELSARLSGLVGSGGSAILMGEVAFNYWFEDIFSLTNYYLTRQRWGLSLKYFRSVSPLQISQTNSNLQATTFDLKYRINPGLWSRDESVGLSASYQEFTYDVFDAKMAGVGIFWARSMPKAVDDILNTLPFLRYPKWTDVEFIYYLSPMSSDVSLQTNSSTGGNCALNFHGKVMWSKRFFGEAGFGLKQLDFIQKFASSESQKGSEFSFTSLYGTVGLGINF